MSDRYIVRVCSLFAAVVIDI